MKQEISVDLAGGKRISFETGKLAKQAHGSVVVRVGDNVVLATATANADPREGIDFFPLTVDYREYTYAGGRIPGGFIKREGRPSEREILTSRQIDRPVRPLFPDGFKCETQVIAFVLSADTELTVRRPHLRFPIFHFRVRSVQCASASWTASSSLIPATARCARAFSTSWWSERPKVS